MYTEGSGAVNGSDMMVMKLFADYAVASVPRSCRMRSSMPPSARSSTGSRRCCRAACWRPRPLLIEALDEQVGHGRALLYPSGQRAPAPVAALINGTASHTVEFDDIFRDAIYHPGCPVIAAALALGQARQVDGDRFLRAVLVGYEVSTRIGAVMVPAHYKYWHSTGTVGCFGAAAAAAAILGLDQIQFANAMGTAGTFAAGLQQAFRSDSMTKPLHAGRAAETGVLAALGRRQGRDRGA
ncbi:MAG: MmgE/PrpD family protein [Pseudomonadota bacterium]